MSNVYTHDFSPPEAGPFSVLGRILTLHAQALPQSGWPTILEVTLLPIVGGSFPDGRLHQRKHVHVDRHALEDAGDAVGHRGDDPILAIPRDPRCGGGSPFEADLAWRRDLVVATGEGCGGCHDNASLDGEREDVIRLRPGHQAGAEFVGGPCELQRLPHHDPLLLAVQCRILSGGRVGVQLRAPDRDRRKLPGCVLHSRGVAEHAACAAGRMADAHLERQAPLPVNLLHGGVGESVSDEPGRLRHWIKRPWLLRHRSVRLLGNREEGLVLVIQLSSEGEKLLAAGVLNQLTVVDFVVDPVLVPLANLAAAEYVELRVHVLDARLVSRLLPQILHLRLRKNPLVLVLLHLLCGSSIPPPLPRGLCSNDRGTRRPGAGPTLQALSQLRQQLPVPSLRCDLHDGGLLDQRRNVFLCVSECPYQLVHCAEGEVGGIEVLLIHGVEPEAVVAACVEGPDGVRVRCLGWSHSLGVSPFDVVLPFLPVPENLRRVPSIVADPLRIARLPDLVRPVLGLDVILLRQPPWRSAPPCGPKERREHGRDGAGAERVHRGGTVEGG
mmetsp:Transcript_63134/g.144636  ORF Transcript_63134/g.144636 Transcript_63134/m.144636 type:complete len:555 (+) Transcript_63134:137-1801(+)